MLQSVTDTLVIVPLTVMYRFRQVVSSF